LTDTAEAPFDLALDDHDASLSVVAFGPVRPFGAGILAVDASTLSWLQSSLSTSMSFMSTSFVSTSLISRAGVASPSSAASAASSEGGVCALAASTAARLKPAASASSPRRLPDVVKIIAPPVARCANMRSFWREIMAALSAAQTEREIRGRCSGRPSVCSTSS